MGADEFTHRVFINLPIENKDLITLFFLSSNAFIQKNEFCSCTHVTWSASFKFSFCLKQSFSVLQLIISNFHSLFYLFLLKREVAGIDDIFESIESQLIRFKEWAKQLPKLSELESTNVVSTYFF